MPQNTILNGHIITVFHLVKLADTLLHNVVNTADNQDIISQANKINKHLFNIEADLDVLFDQINIPKPKELER